MEGKIILDNGLEAPFTLSDGAVMVLEHEAAETRKMDSDNEEYSIADELKWGLFAWIAKLREQNETQAAGTAREPNE